MNLKETVQLIQETAQAAVGVEVQSMPNNPEKSLVLAGGKATPLDTPFVAQPRKHVIETIESFAAAYARWGESSGEDLAPANIWVDMPNWRLLFFTDEPLRRSTVTMKLKPSPQLATTQQFRTAVRMDQKTLVRMLRHDLADCVTPDVLAAFRTVDFQKIRTVRAQQQHEKQSLDADVVSQVMGEKKPEGFVIDLPLFACKELADVRSRVGITIDIDCDDCKFVLQAKPGHLEMAIDDARAAVLDAIQNDLAGHKLTDVVILDGTPE